MEKSCYDWDKNLLYFEDKNGCIFNIQLKGKKTIIYGDSGTGKSLICSKIKDFQEDSNVGYRPYTANNIIIIDNRNIDLIGRGSNNLIIIDRIEKVLTDDLVLKINTDRENRYLLIGRKALGIDISPNYYGELIQNNNLISIRYKYNIGGWN